MQAGEYRSMTDVELNKAIADLRRGLFDRKQELLTGELENTNLIKRTRIDLARALTVKQERDKAKSNAA